MLVVKCSRCAALTPKVELRCRSCKEQLAGSVHEIDFQENEPSPHVSPRSPTPEQEGWRSDRFGPPWWLLLAVGGLLLFYLDAKGKSAFAGVAIAVLFVVAVSVVAFFVSAMMGPGTTRNASYGLALFLLLMVLGMLHDCMGPGGGSSSNCYEAGRYGEYMVCD